jgi:ubiquinone/menaquinone biosynthesis C-methylase UbiE
MSLHDIDDMEAAVAEAGRVLVSGGRFCFAIVHPISHRLDRSCGGLRVPKSYFPKSFDRWRRRAPTARVVVSWTRLFEWEERVVRLRG